MSKLLLKKTNTLIDLQNDKVTMFDKVFILNYQVMDIMQLTFYQPIFIVLMTYMKF